MLIINNYSLIFNTRIFNTQSPLGLRHMHIYIWDLLNYSNIQTKFAVIIFKWLGRLFHIIINSNFRYVLNIIAQLPSASENYSYRCLTITWHHFESITCKRERQCCRQLWRAPWRTKTAPFTQNRTRWGNLPQTQPTPCLMRANRITTTTASTAQWEPTPRPCRACRLHRYQQRPCWHRLRWCPGSLCSPRCLHW